MRFVSETESTSGQTKTEEDVWLESENLLMNEGVKEAICNRRERERPEVSSA